jgi:hypothetical protein
MFSNYVIEVGEQEVGLVVLERAGFRFFAALKGVRALEGEIYRTVAAATRAATGLLAVPPLASPDRVGRPEPIDPAADRWLLGGWFVEQGFHGSHAECSPIQASMGRSE